MPSQIRLGRFFGITIGLHFSWFFIALLITFSVVGHLHFVNPDWSPQRVWGLALLTTGLFFGTLVLHEASHAWVARLRGIPVKSITLFAMGGTASIEKEAGDPKTEFCMGLVGPLTSGLIGALCLSVAYSLGWRANPITSLTAVLVWVGLLNNALAIFNLIPGFPLDGGRILRAIVWGITHDAERATRIAARTGRGIGAVLIVSGVYHFFDGAGFNGLWLAFLGWFLYEAAGASYAQFQTAALLQRIHIADVMTREALVMDTVMRRTDPTVRIGYTATAQEALDLMRQRGIHQLPVYSDGHCEGVISRGHLLQLLETHSELHM